MATPDRPRPRIGFLAFVEHNGVDGARSDGLRAGFRLFEHAEKLGYDSGWVRTRHLEPYLSAPLPFLAAVAQRTRRLQLGTSVVPIRYEDPVRLAEEAATTDLVTEGRLELGLSSGYAQNEKLFGSVYGPIDRSFDDEVDQRLQRFLYAVRGGTLAVADADTPFAPEGTPLTAQPLSPTLAERISYGAGRLATAHRTGRLGLRLQLSTLNTEVTELSFEDAQARQIAAYRQAYSEATGREGFVSVGRMILPILDTGDREAYAFLIERSEKRRRAHGTPEAPALHFGVAHYGDPESIAAALKADAAVQAADELIVVLPFGHAPEVSHRIIETVMQEIVPALDPAVL
jgi:alkanesulfonate monooxygenase SsuD/methylene tetrahydromethanopterin reductase-like flavin-dependent oxidoreductase (luciferase family)